MNINIRFSQKTLLLTILVAGISFSCYKFRGHYGGRQNPVPTERKTDVRDIAIPDGYEISVVTEGLTYPTALTFDKSGNIYVIESGYSYGEVFTESKLIKISADGSKTEIAKGGKNGPWNGVIYHEGFFYISEGGAHDGGKILKISEQGEISELVSKLPSYGDHHTNGPVIGNDGYLYFSVGTATNSGVVGKDNYEFGWLKRRPEFHDIPCADITLSGQNFKSHHFDSLSKSKVETGPFLPFGQKATEGQIIKGEIPCSGAVFKVRTSGGNPELVAWGFRNPYGLSVAPDGAIFISENGYDMRGSRPVYGSGDVLWKLEQGKWYGWPDYTAGEPLADKDYKTPHDDPKFILLNHPSTPPKPAAILACHSSSNGFDFSSSSAFGFEGEAFIAQFGDMTPNVGKLYGAVGFKVVRVNPGTGVIIDFAVNRGKYNNPATRLEKGGLERPVDVKFSNDGKEMYIVDFGIMNITKQGPDPKPGTGVIWRVRRK